ncbi:MAG: hypothetical protein RBJ76_08135 [Stenomitos frigidus ULC029]
MIVLEVGCGRVGKGGTEGAVLNESPTAVVVGDVATDENESIADDEGASDKVGMSGRDGLGIVVRADSDGASGGKTNASDITNGAGDSGNDINGSLIATGADSDEVGISGSKEFVVASGLDSNEFGVIGRNGSAIIVGAGDDGIDLGGKNCSGIIVRDGNDDSEVGENNGLSAALLIISVDDEMASD